MSTKAKVWTIIGVVALICLLLLIVKYQYDIIQRQKAIERSFVEQKELADGIMRSQSSYATKKDIENYAKDIGLNLKPIKDDLNKLNADIKSINTVRIITPGETIIHKESTRIIERDNPEPIDPNNPDPHGYMQSNQKLELVEPFSDQKIPFGEAGFSAWQANPWDLKVYSREYQLTNVVGQDENGKHYVYNKFSINVNGETYDVKVTEAKTLQELPKSKFRFSPRIFFGADGGLYVTDPNPAINTTVQVFWASHGQTKPDPNWIFLGTGLGYEAMQNRLGFTFTPVSYNVAHHIPLINNLFLGPAVSFDLNKDVALMLGLRVGL